MSSKQRAKAPKRAPKTLTSYQLPIATGSFYGTDGRAITDSFVKARRIGGSTAAAYRAALLATGRELHVDGSFTWHEPMDVWVVGQDFPSSKGVLREIAESCDSMADEDPDFRVDAQATCIRFPTGRTITALPCSAAACRGKTGALIADEVAFWRRPEEVYAAAKIIANPNLGQARGYPALLVSTPWEAGSLAHRLFTDASYPFRRHSVDIYQAKAAGFPIDPERERQELGIPELFATEYECLWQRGGSSFFPIDKLRDCQEDDLPDNWQDGPLYLGIDVGGGKGRDNTAGVAWRPIGNVCWMTGVRAFNNLDHVQQCDEIEGWVVQDTTDSTYVTVGIDAGIMGGPMITELRHRFKRRRRVRIMGLNMTPTDQERYATTARRALEHNRIKLYTGTDAGGDEHGARALMLEMSMLKVRPGMGGHLSFATPRDPSKGHCDRAWAAMFGLSRIDGASSMGGPSAGTATFTNVGTYSHDHEGLGFG